MAGGDGSLMTLVMMAKEAGCDIATLVCCVLPYGTGNDLARVLNWGGSEGDLKIYSSLPQLVREICLNSDEKALNVWTIMVKYRANGTTYEIDNKTRDYFSRNETVFERYMINYWSMGEDARVGTGFEKKRTKNRFCNTCVYGSIGLCNWICGGCCGQRPPLITEQIEYVKTLKGKQVLSNSSQQEKTVPKKEALIVEEEEETKEQLINPFLPKGDDGILFTTNTKDPNHIHINQHAVSWLALNIPSFMGGRANPWPLSDDIGLKNPYSKSSVKGVNSQKNLAKQFNFQQQDPSDNKLEFISFNFSYEMAFLRRGWRLAQEEGPIEFKFRRFDNDNFTYMNIDGEFYKIKNPDTVTIQLAKEALPTGSLKILVRRSEDR